MNYLPNKLLKLRKHYNYSQSYLAEILGVDTLTYMGYENGRAVLNYKEMKKLASFYRISIVDIFRNDEDVPLYDVGKANTDEINISYFTKDKTVLQKAVEAVKNHTYITIGAVVLIIAVVVLVLISSNKQPTVDYVPEVIDTNKLAVSDTSVVYIDKTGGVKGSGDNANGQLNNLPSENVIKVAEGASFTIVLKADGTIESCGLMSKYADELKNWTNIVDIAAGDGHIIACDNSGNIYATGDNTYDQCDVTEFNDIVKVYASSKGSVGISSEGRIYTCGEFFGSSMLKSYKNILDVDFSDQILVILNENNTVEYYSKSKDFNEVNLWKDIVDVACGNEFIAALDKNGDVYLSIDNVKYSDEVEHWSNIIAIDAGKEYLIGYDGESISGVGKNSYHQFEAGEIIKQVLPQVTNVKITYDEESIYVQFDPVTSASGYLVEFDEGIGHSYIASDNEVVKFDASTLENEKTYAITITTIGEGDYQNSQPLQKEFQFIIEEEPVEPEPEPEPVETPFVIDSLIGKTKNNFEAYLTGLGIETTKLHPEESEESCNPDDSEPTILEVTGISEGESITKSELQNREITYKYCKVVSLDE